MVLAALLLLFVLGARGYTTRISVPEAIRDFGSLTFIDASWYHKGPRNGLEEFATGPRISNARYFGTMKPTVQDLDDLMSCYSHDSDIVLYGQEGAFFVPRVWFLIRHVAGHHQCRILDGTLADWQNAGGPVEYGAASTLDFPLLPTSNHDDTSSLMDLNDMKQVVEDGGVILDARGSSFQKGHMPGAINVPYSSLHDKGGQLKSIDDLAKVLSFVEPKADVSVTCGSGVSACTIFLALEEIGHQGRVRLYDGSWAEWQTHDELPKVLPSS